MASFYGVYLLTDFQRYSDCCRLCQRESTVEYESVRLHWSDWDWHIYGFLQFYSILPVNLLNFSSVAYVCSS